MGDSTTIALNLTFFGTLGLAFLMFLGLFLLVVATLVLAGVGRLMVLTVLALFGRLPKHESLPLVRLTGEQGTPSHDDDAAPSSAKPPRAGVLRARALRAKAAALRAKAAALRARTRAALSKARARCRAAFSMAAAWCSAMTAALLAPRDWRQAARNGRDLLKPSEFRPRLREAVEHHPLLTAARREQPVLAEDWAAAVAEADARAMARARASAPEIKVSVRELPAPSVPAAKVEAVAPLVESALHRDVPERVSPGRDGRGAARSFTKPPAAAPMSLLNTGSLVSLSGHATVLKAKLPADT
ncbi:hypothetical protein [[Micrococcus luteus] ATCC 49442]|uniref:hypothetical protein n=1 Tax=[Micrococcus luteus] ATCC 49442 TaxID=2698727 RepID=UPI0013DBC4FC|nr:hypothetical protein [[Micrococcus luteus] ATCC 49442]